MGKKAIVVGATGLIGGHLLDILLDADAYDEVLILVQCFGRSRGDGHV